MGTGYTRNDTSNNIADGNIINASDLDGEFDAVESAFNSSTGHTHDGTAAEGGAITVVGPVQDLVVSATEVKPKTTNTLDLGTSGLLYKDAYLQGNMYFRDTALKIVSSADGQLDIDADVELELVAPTVDIDASTALTVDTASTTFTSTVFNVTGSANITGDLDVDNININGNTIISTDTNGDINISPDGTGTVVIDTDLDVDNINVNGNTVSSTDTNGDINLSPNGTGTVVINTDLDVDNININGNTISSTDTNGNINLVPDGTGGVDVTGTMTADGLTVDTDTLYVDSTNNRVGIGTTSPSSKLNVVGDQAIFSVSAGTANLGIQVKGTALSAIPSAQTQGYIGIGDSAIGVAGDLLIAPRTSVGGSVRFITGTSPAERMRIDSSGSVGIGTDSPSGLLHLSANTATTTLPSIVFQDTGTTSTRLGSLTNNNGDLVLAMTSSLTDLRSSITLFDDRKITFATSGSEKMRIDNSGNLLVRTTLAGSAGLSIQQGQNLGWSESAGQSLATIFRQSNSGATVIANGYRHTNTASGFASSYSISWPKAAVALNYGTIRFYADSAVTTAAGTDVTPTERMRIDSSGNVGIGTVSPASDAGLSKIVEIEAATAGFKATATGGSSMEVYSASTASYVDTTTNHPIIFRPNKSAAMRIDSSGNVGIGSNNPQNVLDLGSGTGGGGIAWGGSAGTNHYNTIWSEYSSASLVLASGLKGSTSSSNFIHSFTGTIGYAAIELDGFADDGIKFYTASDAARTAGTTATKNERMRIDNNGFLLVGTTTTDTTAGSGFTVQPDGQLFASADSQQVATLTRLTNDGNIITFRRSAVGGGGLTTVGSIKADSGDLVIDGGASHTGLRFVGSYIQPRLNGSGSNGGVDLGAGSSRFKDLFLFGSLDGGVGARSTSGTLDWNDATNARSGSGFSLLLGSATNGPGAAGYFHSFCFEYSNRGGTGNMTQWAIGYSDQTLRYMRCRFGGTWTSWSAF